MDHASATQNFSSLKKWNLQPTLILFHSFTYESELLFLSRVYLFFQAKFETKATSQYQKRSLLLPGESCMSFLPGENCCQHINSDVALNSCIHLLHWDLVSCTGLRIVETVPRCHWVKPRLSPRIDTERQTAVELHHSTISHKHGEEILTSPTDVSADWQLQRTEQNLFGVNLYITVQSIEINLYLSIHWIGVQ